jgi:hypothetical protein
MNLLTAIERHLRDHSVSASRFGRQVSGDPRFVFDLRRGREPRPMTEARVRAHLACMAVMPMGRLNGTETTVKNRDFRGETA